MDYRKLLEYLGIFVLSFLLVYSLYYGFIRRPFIRARKKQKEKKMPADLSIIKHFYKVDVEKVGYNYCLRLLNINNSFFIAVIVVLIIGFKYYVIKMIIAAALVIPAIWFSYMLVAKILKRKERKINNV